LAHKIDDSLIIQRILHKFENHNHNKIMTRFLSSYKMIVLMGLSSALGYTTTTPISRPAPFVIVSTPPTTTEDQQAFRPSWFVPNVVVAVEANNKPQKVSYDLGLGKNQPVHGGKRNTQHQHQANTNNVVRHMVQYESARPYPSPLVQRVMQEEQTAPAVAAAAPVLPKKKRSLPKVQLERKAQDVLKIHMQHHHHNMEDDSSLPTMVGKHQHMDLNTVWVEMWIHNQQQEERHYQQQQLAMAPVV
jgi:hypothetical protein